jgi:hypothetical protein
VGIIAELDAQILVQLSTPRTCIVGRAAAMKMYYVAKTIFFHPAKFLYQFLLKGESYVFLARFWPSGRVLGTCNSQ